MIYEVLPAAHLLRRHVGDGSHDQARGSLGFYRQGFGPNRALFSGSNQLGQAEVQNLDVPIFGNEDVFRLEVPMDDTFLMCRSQTAQNLHGIVERLANRQTLELATLMQRLSVQ